MRAYVPRTLGRLQANSNCNLFGWGGAESSPRSDLVSISGPQTCLANLPQVFCSSFYTDVADTCAASLGSPVLCGDNSAIDGFLIGGGCAAVGSQNTLYFHTVEPFNEWINENTNAGMTAKIPGLVILSTVLMSLKGLA